MAGLTRKALLSIAIKPRTPADHEKLARGLAALTAEDATMSADTDPVTGEAVVGGMGELHLEIIVDRLKSEFNVEFSVGRPEVAYKEALTRRAEGEGRYTRWTGGGGQYGHARIRVMPRQPGDGYEFINAIAGGSIPGEFIKPIDLGIRESMTAGVLAGYPIEDVTVELYDGSFHDVESSELSFRIAGTMAFQDAARKANPVLLEPIMSLEVVVPEEHAGDVIGRLSSRRGQVQSLEYLDGIQRISARVPLPEMFGWATDLRSRTRGRGTFAMQFACYQPCERADDQDTGDDSKVGAPHTPMPRRPDSGVALPEPREDEFGH